MDINVPRCDHYYGVGPFDEFSEWATAFNEVYKQAKHADHPLPNLHRAAILAQSGATLVRLWLAQEFGVTRLAKQTDVRGSQILVSKRPSTQSDITIKGGYAR